jgi:hypothetical protein
MKQLLINIGIIISLFILNPVLLIAQSSAASAIGGLPGAPFRMGFGARGIGMGNALTAVPFDNVSSYYNPALLPLQASPTVLLSYGSLSLDRRLNFASYAQHLNPDAGLSAGIINAGVSNIDGRDNDGIPTETYSTSENQFFFSFGMLPDKKFAFGVTAKVLYYHLFSNVKSTTFGVDIGTLYSISDELKLAVVIQDILSKYKWDTSKIYGVNGSSTEDKFPLRKRLGASYYERDLGLLVSAEAEMIGQATFARVGAELELFSGLQVRGGIDQISFSGAVTSKPSLGFSIQAPVASWNPRFDYAYVVEPYVSAGMHFLTLTLSF